MDVTLSQFREDPESVLDRVVETGEPARIEYKGRVLRIVAGPPQGPQLVQMAKRPEVNPGAAADRLKIEWVDDWDSRPDR